ncbi:WxcM-like domain-containing protein [Pedobacter cryoconitis]|uniref:WxcM-like domain-containing protein n=1 Tax=Pedobacter cryoconitis TaxID=188932 RepID=UPI00161F4E53
MAYIINIQTFKDSRGILTVLDQVIPFEIKRLFYIYSVDNTDHLKPSLSICKYRRKYS